MKEENFAEVHGVSTNTLLKAAPQVLHQLPMEAKSSLPGLFHPLMGRRWNIRCHNLHQSSQVENLSAGTEAEMKTPSISGKVKAVVDMDKKILNKEIETTVSMIWFGGGSIKRL